MNNNSEIKISVCTIVKNEEKQISDFIHSLIDFADEIVIVDTGSSDKTMDIVTDFTKKNHCIKLYKYEKEGLFHYGLAKNFSIKKATKDFIIILDADERLSEKFKDRVRDFLSFQKPNVVMVKRVDEIVPHLIDYPERIIKKGKNIFYKIDEIGMVHEQLDHFYKNVFFEQEIIHQQRFNHYVYRPQRILFQLELQIERTPKTKNLLGHILRGVWYSYFRFKKLYFNKELYKDGIIGFKYSFMRSLDAFLIEFFVGLKPNKNFNFWDKK